ncbi:MAG: hypothetical protein HOE30_08565, partial [Deltaproteobacteria bacterium]|nr:hypothetical protein [Deltaproteobacteria bacterium]
MNTQQCILGIDIGSISISIAELDLNKTVLKTAYSFHNGDIKGCLKGLLKQFELHEVCSLAITSSTPAIINHATSFDSRICYITAARHLNEKVGSLLIVGGEKFGVVLFDQNGEYL